MEKRKTPWQNTSATICISLVHSLRRVQRGVQVKTSQWKALHGYGCSPLDTEESAHCLHLFPSLPLFPFVFCLYIYIISFWLQTILGRKEFLLFLLLWGNNSPWVFSCFWITGAFWTKNPGTWAKGWLTSSPQGGVLQREIKLLSPWRHLITSQDAEVETFPYPPQISIFTLQSKSCFFCHQRAEGQMRKPPYMSCKFIVLGFLLQVTNPNICTGHTWLSLQYLGMKNWCKLLCE